MTSSDTSFDRSAATAALDRQAATAAVDQPAEAAAAPSPLQPPAVALPGSGDLADRLVPGVFLVLPLLWVVAYFFPPLNQDVAVILSVAERWMGGERLYVDVIDVNPPLIFMLNLIPVALAKVTPFSAPSALMICVLGLALWSALASYRLLVTLAVVRSETLSLLVAPLLLFILIVFPSEMFGQREHLMALGMIPYLLLAAARCEQKPVAWPQSLTIAVVAALGFALKPHFVVIPLAVEIYLLAIRRDRRALLDVIPWLMVVIMALYALLAWLWTPAYFTFVMPLVMSAYEQIGGISFLEIILGKHLAPYLFLLLPLTVAAFRTRWHHAARLTAVAALAATVAGVAQNKGWPYHLLPAQMAAMLMFVWALARAADTLQQSGGAALQHVRSFLALFLLLIYCFAGAARYALYDQMEYWDSSAGQWERILNRHAGGSSALMITPGIYPHFPAINYAKVKQASRFLTVWPLQGAYEGCGADEPRYHTPDRMTEAEKLFNRMLAEDLTRNKPRLVVIDRIPGIPWCGGQEFDFLEYYEMQPAFAKEWQHYDYIATYDRYDLYVRRSAPSTTR